MENSFYYSDISLGFNYWDADGVFNKDLFVKKHIAEMLSRVGSMFHYENLPDTVDSRMLELFLQTYGACFFTKVDDCYYVFRAGLGGEPDVYYRPTIAIVANPALNLSKEFKIGSEGVVCLNDTMLQGLIPTFSLYGRLIAENIISMKVALVNNRQTSVITANTDSGKASAELYLKRLEDGQLSVVMDKGLEEGIRAQPVRVSNDNALTSLIEHQQYLKASEFNAIGINANYNMKRESITSSESDLNNESLFPTVDNMLECRKRWVDEVNKLYGLDISVDLSSVWKHKRQSSELEIIKSVNDLATTLPNNSSTETLEVVESDESCMNEQEEVCVDEQVEPSIAEHEGDTKDDDALSTSVDNMAEVVEALTEDVLVDLELASEVEEEGDSDESDKDENSSE